MDKFNLFERFAQVSDHWRPTILSRANGQQVAAVKLLGESAWCDHESEDVFFLVVKGQFRVDFRDGAVWLSEGDYLTVPCKVEHRYFAETEAHVLMFECSRPVPHAL